MGRFRGKGLRWLLPLSVMVVCCTAFLLRDPIVTDKAVVFADDFRQVRLAEEFMPVTPLMTVKPAHQGFGDGFALTVCGNDRPVLKVFLSAAGLHWQIRKPGIYAADPVELRVYSNRRVRVTFSDFADLAGSGPGQGALPAYYGMGDTLQDVEGNGWYTAAKWNEVQITTRPAQVGTTVVWRIWPRIEVAGTTRAGRYADTGKITVTVLETAPYVQSLAQDGRGEEQWLTGTGFGTDRPEW